MKYWIRPASLTVEAKQSEIAELFEKFASIPFVDRINSQASMEHMRRGYLEDFIRESNSSLIEELNVRSLEDLLVSEEVAEEKDEGIAIKNIWTAYVWRKTRQVDCGKQDRTGAFS